MSLPMRGGINSDDAFRFVYELYGSHPEIFNPYVVMRMEPEDISRAVKKSASNMYPEGTQGEKEKGTFSYQSDQHERFWIHNAKMLVEHWGGDIRNVFKDESDFEEAFARIDHKRVKHGFKGMRRKIFSLMTTWLVEFGLIPEFNLPLIIDFHALRLLLMHEILKVEFRPLGEGNPKREKRRRPESIRHYPAVAINESFVDQVILWTLKFLKRHPELSQYDVAHGMWFLSRVLCAAYFGNRSYEQKNGDLRRGLTERLVTDEELLRPGSWPVNYRDPCIFCPIEYSCKDRYPQGPYFDWGRMVKAGRHITDPMRAHYPKFQFITKDMPMSFPGRTRRDSLISNGKGIEPAENISLQLTLGFTEKT